MRFDQYIGQILLLRYLKVPAVRHGGLFLDICSAFGKVLRKRRLAAGLSQERLGLEANVQRNFVSLIERGVNQPTITVLFKLASALRCPPSELMAEVEGMLEQNCQRSEP